MFRRSNLDGVSSASCLENGDREAVGGVTLKSHAAGLTLFVVHGYPRRVHGLRLTRSGESRAAGGACSLGGGARARAASRRSGFGRRAARPPAPEVGQDARVKTRRAASYSLYAVKPRVLFAKRSALVKPCAMVQNTTVKTRKLSARRGRRSRSPRYAV